MTSFIYNRQGTAIYKKVVMAAFVIGAIIFILLLKRTSKIEQNAPNIEKQAEESGVDLEEFK
ncbi:MAG: hypothetical protein AAB653_03340 [Patescibacteria group bacterium]|mgnify:CR=1 FL=1